MLKGEKSPFLNSNIFKEGAVLARWRSLTSINQSVLKIIIWPQWPTGFLGRGTLEFGTDNSDDYGGKKTFIQILDENENERGT